MRNDISSTDTLYLGIASKPQNLGVALTTQTTGSFRNFMIELQICNSPPANAILRYREYQQVTSAAVPASSTGKYFSRSPSVVENGDGMPATQGLWFVYCAYPHH